MVSDSLHVHKDTDVTVIQNPAGRGGGGDNDALKVFLRVEDGKNLENVGGGTNEGSLKSGCEECQ